MPYSLHHLNLVPCRLALCTASAGDTSAICSAHAVTPTVLLVVRLTSQGSAVPHSSSLSAAAMKETTQPYTGAV